ncbi:C40 family peptidase [Vibrio metoecus]|uniref:Peptidase P60 n=1 Tax=Vibrio metoecus TaxID=1481663 RepID=A0A271VUJ7_VIBMT|nr:NlpC/P60 family protein [Vibrio metoecus]KQA20996.1 peptidase P60 [Vibrio metoecus]KQB08260.1 peptidase P60 [Vibrio metoecus]PAR21499.1 peptidase P60 [Vibrio metoecus]PAR25959.1 peptidase P60 [Vibrio metoecus]PAR36553.1 peptidase P60 [Vibrio metoecus]
MLVVKQTFSLFFLLFLVGCGSTPSSEPDSSSLTPDLSDRSFPSFSSVFTEWRGVPYQFGGNNKNGIDCSAFVQIAYRDAWQLSLPRTTESQAQTGQLIKYEHAQYGDLVFFKTSRTNIHVGVYLGNKQFMHASTSKGVIISRIDNPYWAAKFWQFRRIENPPLVSN